MVRYTSLRFRATGYGIFFFLSYGVGSFASTLSGYMADNFGLEWVFHTMGFLLSISGVFAFQLIILSHKKT